ncbi:MAG: hypothetical protein ACE5JT_01675 [Nitrosopumilaceae archaeon]
MATKKGIALTAAILGGITAASFFVWFIPQDSGTKFVVSNYGEHLDGVIERHGVVADGIETQFQSMLNSNISPEEYVTAAELSSSQINALAIELVESDASQEWHESYIFYIESLKKYNSYLRETIVISNMIKGEESETEIQQSIKGLDILKDESQLSALRSAETRP